MQMLDTIEDENLKLKNSVQNNKTVNLTDTYDNSKLDVKNKQEFELTNTKNINN